MGCNPQISGLTSQHMLLQPIRWIGPVVMVGMTTTGCWVGPSLSCRAPGSLSQIQQVIANDSRHTSCIRQLPDRQLVSWALEMEAGYLGVLHTVEQHRRKGLGRVVLLDLLSKLYKAYLREDVEVQQRLAECGAVSAVSCCACSQNGSCSSCTGCKLQDRSEGLGTDAGGSCWPGGAAYCYVMQGNRPSVALLESVGLVRSQECWWMGFEKK